MSEFDERIAGLSPERRALLKLLLEEEAARPLPRIKPRGKESDHAPLSANQRWLWMLEQMRPGSVWNNKIQSRIKGKLNIPALEQSLGEIVRRQHALRTSFDIIGGDLVQKIVPAPVVTLPLADLSRMTTEDARVELQRLAVEVLDTVFDLTSGLLMKARLVRFGSEDHVLLIALSHLISDGWSNTLFMREAVMLYGAFSSGRPSPLAELPVQYADFAIWQREWLESAEGEAQVARLKERLEDASPFEFRSARQHPDVDASASSVEMIERGRSLSGDLSGAIREMNSEEQVTLFITMLAVFLITLYQYTGQDDVVCGSTIANRHHAEIESVIGFFANPLTLRIKLSGDPSLGEVLRRVRDVTLESFAAQDIPFLTLTKTLQPDYDFKSTFSLHRVLVEMDNVEVSESISQEAGAIVHQDAPGDAPTPALKFGPAQLDYQESASGYDLILRPKDEPRGIILKLLYDPELFDAELIEAMLRHMQELLESMTRNLEQRLSSLQPFVH
ncbi:MAG: hypothetical protein QOD00_1060 [Blastocatellia bacterium]|jgi:hypothetical protein|nr:hypothetical protein [Blastocatellia bacterium]